MKRLKITKGIKKDIKDELQTLSVMNNNALDCISLLQNGFIYNTTAPIKDCKEKVAVTKKQEAQISNKLTEMLRDNPDLKPYLTIPDHLLKIGENIEKLSELITKKIRENILFSDKAVMEMTFLLQRLDEILRPTTEIIFERNTLLSMYIQESQASVGKMAGEYATLHEERLIKGVCFPAASSLYINMLDSVKGIAWHSKEIAVKLIV
jgi:Na+/phosphate symporter